MVQLRPMVHHIVSCVLQGTVAATYGYQATPLAVGANKRIQPFQSKISRLMGIYNTYARAL